MRRRPRNMMQGGRVLAYDEGGEVPDVARAREMYDRLIAPAPRYAVQAAEKLAPNAMSLLRGEPAPPLERPIERAQVPGKVSSVGYDPRFGSAAIEGAEALTNFMPVGGPTKAAGVGLAAAIPFAARALKAEPKGITAYHGSPYDFSKFDISKIGTGEGAQAYGHGLYFAENEGVARSYKLAGKTRPSALQYLGENIQNLPREEYAAMPKLTREALGFARDEANIAEAVQNATSRGRADIADEIMRLHSKGELGQSAPPPGHMYQVRLNAEPERFLDWDKPMREQPSVIKSLGEIWKQPPLESRAAGMTGGDFYTATGFRRETDSGASTALREAGIPGIKYLDQGSRPKLWNAPQMERELDFAEQLLGEYRRMGNQKLVAETESKIAKIKSEMASPGTNNYVVFDPSIIEILKKYGIAGPAGLGAAQMYEGPSPPRASGGRVRSPPRNMMNGGRVL